MSKEALLKIYYARANIKFVKDASGQDLPYQLHEQLKQAIKYLDEARDMLQEDKDEV